MDYVNSALSQWFFFDNITTSEIIYMSVMKIRQIEVNEREVSIYGLCVLSAKPMVLF